MSSSPSSCHVHNLKRCSAGTNDYTEIGEDPAEKGYELTDLDGAADEPDEWTIGSSSSVSSDSHSPTDESLWEGETLASHSDYERSPV